MRTIKFRYWNTINNIMVNEPEMPFKEGWTVEQLFSDRGWIWMQFTGLLDRNGKEIYEGDIVESKQSKIKGKIIWGQGGFLIASPFKFGEKTSDYIGNIAEFFSDREDGIEVIGNIYENKDLIK